jgi:hypothetical protein
MSNPKGTATAFRFDPTVKEALQAIADREGRSMANMLEWLIRKHCEREGLGWPPITSAVDAVHGAALVSDAYVLHGRGEELTFASKNTARLVRKVPTTAKAVSEIESKPSAKKAKNKKAGK